MTRLPMRRVSYSMARAYAATILLVTGAQVSAAGLEVSPTTLQLAPQQPAEGIMLSNIGDTPLHAQVRVFAWIQKDNEDLLMPTAALSVSPPMLRIAPRTVQLLRVIRTPSASAGGTEQAYRLIIDEIPSNAPPPGSDLESDTAGKKGATHDKTSTALSFYMRYSLPVFVGDSNDNTPPSLSWQLAKTARQWTLSVNNVGKTHAQIADLAAVTKPAAQERILLLPGLVGYVLAGQSRSWSLEAPDNAQELLGLEAMINRQVQPLHVDLAR